MKVYKFLSALLDYPEVELKHALAQEWGGFTSEEIAELMDAESQLSHEERQQMARFIDWVRTTEIGILQADYVQTFDLTPEHSLHLTHHLFGDDKNRGPALIDLSEYYKNYGLQGVEGELPDYLPLVLEFVSQLEPDEGRVFLADAAKVLRVLAENLEKADSPYAPLIRIVESQGSLMRLAA